MDTTFVGCDQEVVLNWLLIRACDLDTTFAASVCPGETFAFQGVDYAIGTNNTVQGSSVLGCDTTFNFTVNALPSSTEPLMVAVCAGDSYSFLGVDYPIGTNENIVLMNSAGCDSTIQLQVNATEEAVFSLETEESCLNSPSGQLNISPESGPGPFLYAIDDNDFQVSPNFIDLEAGGYDLTVEDANGCQYAETFSIDALPSLVVNLQDAILPCDSSAILLKPEILSGDDGSLQFSWSDGPNTLERFVSDPGTLVLQVSNNCEVVDIPVLIEAELSAQSHLIYVPSAFSPNNDGVNDEFKLYPNVNVDIDELDFQVFDRWGSVLFDAQQWDDGWEGTTQGRRALSGAYIWRLNAKVNLCGRQIDVVQHGEVILVR